MEESKADSRLLDSFVSRRTDGSPLPLSDPQLAVEELRERITWLVRLRWAAVAGVLVTAWGARHIFGVSLAEAPLYAVTAFLAAYNLAFLAIGRRLSRQTGATVTRFANIQIALDLIALTLLLHFAGGIENPFVCYYVFHTVIASILLSRRAAYLQASLAIALLAAMALLEATGTLKHYHLKGFVGDDIYRSPIYVLGMLFVIGTMLYISGFMATSITARLRVRETEIVRLSDALQARADDLARAYEAVRQLETARSEYLNRVAHHLRSPLATIERMLAVIAEGRTGEVPVKSMEMLDRARARLQEVLDLARDLLVLSRTREMRRLADRREVDLAAIVRSAAADFGQQAQAVGVSLVVSAPQSAVGVVAHAESLGELLENLLSNAIKYSPNGGEVRVSLTGSADRVELSVADQGMGIAPEEKSRIFDEFYRAANARESGKDGTGLGLSIVKAIVEAHNGEVSVESELGKGTTFRITLPTGLPQS